MVTKDEYEFMVMVQKLRSLNDKMFGVTDTDGKMAAMLPGHEVSSVIIREGGHLQIFLKPKGCLQFRLLVPMMAYGVDEEANYVDAEAKERDGKTE